MLAEIFFRTLLALPFLKLPFKPCSVVSTAKYLFLCCTPFLLVEYTYILKVLPVCRSENMLQYVLVMGHLQYNLFPATASFLRGLAGTLIILHDHFFFLM